MPRDRGREMGREGVFRARDSMTFELDVGSSTTGTHDPGELYSSRPVRNLRVSVTDRHTDTFSGRGHGVPSWSKSHTQYETQRGTSVEGNLKRGGERTEWVRD